MKKCSVCSGIKPTEDFRKYAGASVDGRRPLCSTCQRIYEKKWRSKNKERLRKARWIRSPKAKEYSRRYRAANRAFYLISEARRRCRRLGLDFSLDVTEIQRRIDLAICEVSGYSLDLTPLTTRYEQRANSPSLDRINPKKGYTMDNVRVVCLAVNTAMGTWGEAGFLPIVKVWAQKAAA